MAAYASIRRHHLNIAAQILIAKAIKFVIRNRPARTVNASTTTQNKLNPANHHVKAVKPVRMAYAVLQVLYLGILDAVWMGISITTDVSQTPTRTAANTVMHVQVASNVPAVVASVTHCATMFFVIL